jgi:hypothetical protein
LLALRGTVEEIRQEALERQALMNARNEAAGPPLSEAPQYLPVRRSTRSTRRCSTARGSRGRRSWRSSTTSPTVYAGRARGRPWWSTPSASRPTAPGTTWFGGQPSGWRRGRDLAGPAQGRKPPTTPTPRCGRPPRPPAARARRPPTPTRSPPAPPASGQKLHPQGRPVARVLLAPHRWRPWTSTDRRRPRPAQAALGAGGSPPVSPPGLRRTPRRWARRRQTASRTSTRRRPPAAAAAADPRPTHGPLGQPQAAHQQQRQQRSQQQSPVGGSPPPVFPRREEWKCQPERAPASGRAWKGMWLRPRDAGMFPRSPSPEAVERRPLRARSPRPKQGPDLPPPQRLQPDAGGSKQYDSRG